MKTHYRTCNLCEAMCGIVITHDKGKVLSIKGDKDDPFSQGHICPKATALQDIYEDPDRLKYPVKRTADGWERIGWDEAYALFASNIKQTWAAYGDDAVGIYLGNPNVHNLGAMLYGSSLIKALRTKNRFSATSVDQLPHHVAARHMFGHRLIMPIPDVDRCDYFVIIGGNPMASNGSIMTAGGIDRRMKAIQKRGGKIVVIDPRRTETAKMADEHLFVRPGSDVLLLLAMVRTLFEEGLVEIGRLDGLLSGVETVKQLVQAYAPEDVSEQVGISAETIRRLTREISHAPSAAVYGRIGLSVQPFGGLCNWLLNVINILTGNMDTPGGMMFPSPAVDIADKRRAGKFDRWHSRVRGLPEFSGELPVAALAEEMLTPGDGQLKAMVTVAGNPVLSTPNGRQLDAAFANLDFYAAIDIYINETTRHADLILPPTTGLECEHYDVSFHHFAVHNTAKFSQPLFEKEDAQRHDWQIIQGLNKALADDEHPLNAADPRNSATPQQLLDFMLRTGEYDLTLDDLKANPHGVDLGPLKPIFPDKLYMPDGKIDLAPPAITMDLERVERWFTRSIVEGQDSQFVLIGRRHVRDNNSWMHNSKRLMKGKNRCTVMMHSADSAQLDINKGDLVRVTSRVGSVDLPVEVTDDIMPGVISIPHGYGHGRAGVQMETAQAHAGVSINDLTDEHFLDDLTGNVALNAVPVSVEVVR